MKDALELARQLIAIESITGNERNAGEWVARLLEAAGWPVTRQDVTSNRFNVRAGSVRAKLTFSTHLDTVPPFLTPAEDADFLFGRGACDTKGILAAMVVAADRLRHEFPEDIGLLFVVGEERDSAGARAANQSANESRYLVNGEPTENRLALGSKGSLRVHTVATGRSAHSAYPELGESAILKLLDFLQRARGVALAVDPVLGPSTLNIGTLQGGTRPNIIPDHAEAELMFRTVGDTAALKRQLLDLAGRDVELEWAFEVPPAHLKTLEGFETTVVAYTTDIPFLSSWGQPLLLGPGSIHDAHTADEKISKRQLLEAVELYYQLGKRLISGEGSAISMKGR